MGLLRPIAAGISLVESRAPSGSGTLLLIGDGVFADSLAKTLAGQTVDVERAGIATAATTADVLLPDLVVLAADAAQSRGSAVLTQLQAAGRTTPTLVISAAEAGGLVPVQAAPYVAYITPAGGVIDCAGRVRAVLSALIDDQSAGASLQKLVEKVAGRSKAVVTGAQPRAAGPAKTSPGFPTPLSKAPEAPRAPQVSVQPAKPTGASAASLGAQAAKSTGAIKAGGSEAAATAKATGAVRSATAEANAARAKPTGPAKTPGTEASAPQAKPTGPAKTAGNEASATQAKATAAAAAKPTSAGKTAGTEANAAQAVPQAGKAGSESAGTDAAAPIKDTSPKAANPPKPSAAPASTKGAPVKPLPLSAAGGVVKPTISLGPSARSLTNQPVTVQPPPAASANPPPRTMNTPSLTAKPATSASLPWGTAGQPPAAMRGAQAALTTSPAPAPREVELPTLRPTAPNPQEPALHGAQTVRPAPSPEAPPALTQKAANEQRQPPEVKTAPRIPLRAKRAASTQAPANDAKAAPQLPSDKSTAVTAQPAAKPAAPIVGPPIPSAQLTAARQVSDSEVEIILSDRPVSLAPKLLPADTNPPPPQRPQPTAASANPAITPSAAREPQARAPGAIPQSPPEPPPQTNPRIPRIPGATPLTPANAARHPLEPAPATRATGSFNQSMPAGAARGPLEPAHPPATQTTAASAHSMPASAARNPLEPAQYANAPATRTTGSYNQSMPAGAPRNPLGPASYANAPATRITGAINQSMPAGAQRNPLEPAHPPATQTTGASAHSVPAGPQRNPLAPATRTTGSFNQSMPAGAPRNPLAPATRTTGSFNQRMRSGAPRHPFDAAPREIEPERSASVRNMPSGAPRYPFDAAPRASAAPARPSRDPLTSTAPTGNPQPSASRRAGANTKRRTGRAPTDPFRAAEAPQPRAAAPEGLPDLALSPAADTPSKPNRWRGAWLMGAVAAIGCSVLWLYQTYDSSAARAPGNAATGALSQTPPLNTLPVDHAAPPAISPQPSNAPSVEPEPATTAPNAERRPGSTRRAGESQEAADPTTAAGRARGLVDSGSAMLRQGRYGIAEGMYMKALQEVPEYPPAMAELVRVHLARKDGKEAVRWAELLVAKQSNGLHQLLLGDAQAMRGNNSAAQTAWTNAAKAGNATARQRLAADDEEEEEE